MTEYLRKQLKEGKIILTHGFRDINPSRQGRYVGAEQLTS
jgi:hypothetical protein